VRAEEGWERKTAGNGGQQGKGERERKGSRRLCALVQGRDPQSGIRMFGSARQPRAQGKGAPTTQPTPHIATNTACDHGVVCRGGHRGHRRAGGARACREGTRHANIATGSGFPTQTPEKKRHTSGTLPCCPHGQMVGTAHAAQSHHVTRRCLQPQCERGAGPPSRGAAHHTLRRAMHRTWDNLHHLGRLGHRRPKDRGVQHCAPHAPIHGG
jgi:hypothetical protein